MGLASFNRMRLNRVVEMTPEYLQKNKKDDDELKIEVPTKEAVENIEKQAEKELEKKTETPKRGRRN